MNKHYKNFLFAAVCAVGLSSCSKDSDSSPNGEASLDTRNTKYIITATTGAAGIADYVLTADNLTTGSITTAGNGIEQDGSYRYYITTQNRFFSLLYGQGNPGAVTTYALSAEGKIVKTSNFQAETVQVFAPVDKDVVTIKVPRSGASISYMYRIDAEKSLVVGEAQQDTKLLTTKGERAHYTWATQVGDKVFMPFMSIKGDGVDNFGTQFPDSTWVAVYSYPALKLEKVIRDGRTSYLGAYFTNGLFQDEKGDAYGFSGAIATSNGAGISTKPSAVIKINKGTTEFDQSYFFNLQTKSGGYKIASSAYIGNGKVLVQMYGNVGLATGAAKLAVVDVYAQTFTWVTGQPQIITSTTVGRYNVTNDDATAIFIGINSPDGNFVYSINGTTGVATKGLEVKGGSITVVSKLKY